MKRSELFFTAILIPLDIIATIFGFALAYYIRKHYDPFEIIYIPSIYEYLKLVLYSIPIYLTVFAFFGLYNVKINLNILKEIYRIIFAAPTAIMVFVTFMFFLKEDFFSRLIVIYTLFIITALVLSFRLLIVLIRKILFRYGVGVKRVFLIGTSKTSLDIIKDIERHPNKGFKILGIIANNGDEQKEIKGTKASIIGRFDQLQELISSYNPDEIFQTEPSISTKENLEILELCEDKNITFRFVPNLFSLYSKNNDSDAFGKIPVFEVRRSNLEGWGRIIKRCIDIACALFGILISLPIQIIIAIIIKTTSRGPVFFKQKRVGRDGEFLFYKFRTMYDTKDADARHAEYIKKYGNMFKLSSDQDPRVTKIGRFLRKTSLDEIPQFYNVLRGDMSMVGPRPPMPVEVERYTREEKKRIGGVKPGLTGLWQVSGRSDIQFDEWVKLDVYYIENWSLALDIWIIFKTIWVIVFRRGAY